MEVDRGPKALTVAEATRHALDPLDMGVDRFRGCIGRIHSVFSFYSRKPQADSIPHARTGGVNQIQRYGSALNADTHFHALVLDGVSASPDALTAPRFHPATRITDAEVAKLLLRIHLAVLRLCRARGLMGEEGELDASALAETQGLLPLLCAASIQGRSALGSVPGARVERRGIPELAISCKGRGSAPVPSGEYEFILRDRSVEGLRQRITLVDRELLELNRRGEPPAPPLRPLLSPARATRAPRAASLRPRRPGLPVRPG